jgi:hypothetical protein
MKGSFWWRSLLKLLNAFKGIAQAHFGTGQTIFFWSDMWNGSILQNLYAQLFSYTTNNNITVKSVTVKLESLDDLFHLPLSLEAYGQFCELEINLQSLQQNNDKDMCGLTYGAMQTTLQ